MPSIGVSIQRRRFSRNGIGAISLVVANLYPFTSQPGIELIDIGGPAMVRAAAKNFAFTTVVTDPADFWAHSAVPSPFQGEGIRPSA